MNPRVIEGNSAGGDIRSGDIRIGIVASRFNKAIVEGLLNGALEVLNKAGIENSDIFVVWVPGALEIPMAAKRLAETRDLDGLIALGCVIRGETSHFEHVAQGAISGLSMVGLDLGIPVATGVLTVETLEQARIRAGLDADPIRGKEGRERHRGKEAAKACIEMIDLFKKIGNG